MVSMMKDRQLLMQQYHETCDKLKAEYNASVKEAGENVNLQLAALASKCLAVNGKHVDDGSMFYPTCKYCGFSDDFYNPSEWVLNIL